MQSHCFIIGILFTAITLSNNGGHGRIGFGTTSLCHRHRSHLSVVRHHRFGFSMPSCRRRFRTRRRRNVIYQAVMSTSSVGGIGICLAAYRPVFARNRNRMSSSTCRATAVTKFRRPITMVANVPYHGTGLPGYHPSLATLLNGLVNELVARHHEPRFTPLAPPHDDHVIEPLRYMVNAATCMAEFTTSLLLSR